MAAAVRSWLPPFALVLGIALMLGYGACQVLEPHGAFEFAYAPSVTGLLPYSPMRGFTYEQLWGHVRRVLLLGPGLVLFVWGLHHYLRLNAPRDLLKWTKLAAAACLSVTAVLMLGVLRGRAIVDDELAYGMQAGFFRHGHVGGPELGLNPADTFTVFTRVGYSIKYLPGEPVVQMLGTLVDIPALAHLLVVAVTLWAWYRALSLSSGVLLARLSTIALACSPILMFTSATGLSHASCLMWVVLMGLGYELAQAGFAMRGAALAGVAFSAGLLTRPQSMVPIGAVIGVALLWRLLRRRAWTSALVLAVGAGAGLCGLLLYNRFLTGAFLRLPWFLQCDAEHYGFGRVWVTQRYEHNVWTALQNLLVVAVRLNAWLLGLPWSLGVVLVWLTLGRRTAGAGIWLWVGLAVLVFEFFYYSPGVSDTGSIYHYELVLPFALMAGVVAQHLLERFPKVAPLALACALLFGTGSWIVEQGLRLNRLITLIHRDSDRVLSSIKAPAVLIYERRATETVSRGWLMDAFPRRYRDADAPIVTLPRVSERMPQIAARTYPGRACWYFHYRPGTAVPELLPCEAARAWLERPLTYEAPDQIRPYLERSTAYLKTDYLPATYLGSMTERDAEGRPLLLCCQKRALTRLDAQSAALNERACVETGEP